MNVREFVTDINRQLDISPESHVTFNRKDSFKLMTLLTMLANLIDRGQDKTVAQTAVFHVQRADAAERRVRMLEAEVDRQADVVDSAIARVRELEAEVAQFTKGDT